MSEHTATVTWTRNEDIFRGGRYSRVHAWQFDGGARVAASASPQVVRAPWSDPSGVDPEEAFVASISSCHMLWFLSLCADQGLIVDSYDDQAVGYMRATAQGRMAIVEVALRPRVVFTVGKAADSPQLDALHAAAHESCFIANSVKTKIRIESR